MQRMEEQEGMVGTTEHTPHFFIFCFISRRKTKEKKGCGTLKTKCYIVLFFLLPKNSSWRVLKADRFMTFQPQIPTVGCGPFQQWIFMPSECLHPRSKPWSSFISGQKPSKVHTSNVPPALSEGHCLIIFVDTKFSLLVQCVPVQGMWGVEKGQLNFPSGSKTPWASPEEKCKLFPASWLK